MNSFLFFYIEANVFSIIISSIFIYKELKNIDKQIRNIEFLKSIIIYVSFYVADIICYILELDRFSNLNVLKTIIIYIQLSTFTYGSYQWFIYSEVAQDNKQIYKAENRTRWGMPVFIFSAIFIVYMVIVLIKNDNEILNVYIDIIHFTMLFTAIAYELITSVKSLKRFHENKNNIRKNEFLFMGLSPLIFCSFIVLQAIFINIPIFCFLNTIWMICFYLMGMEDLISIDSLTKLNNRNQLKKYYHQLIHDNKYSNYLLVIDIDHFKNINDKYGHIEGDNALILVSDTFKYVCSNYPYKIFISRYGGDEFVIIAQALSEENIIDLKNILNKELEKKSREKHLPYNLSISTGYTKIENCYEKFNQFIAEADKAMYMEKERKYSNEC